MVIFDVMIIIIIIMIIILFRSVQNYLDFNHKQIS